MSGSDQYDATKLNNVESSTPLDGDTSKFPGRGDPFVVIVIDALVFPHDKLNIRVDLCGRDPAATRNWKLFLDPNNRVFEIGVRATDLKLIWGLSTLQVAEQVSIKDSEPTNNKFWLVLKFC